MILKFFKNIWRVVKSTLLCIRFPFLYPRNRFTGNHYDYWKIIRYHRSNYTKANFFFTIDLINEDRKDEVREFYKYIDNIYLRVEHSGTELIIIKGPKEKIIKRIDLGSEIYYSGWVNGNLVVKVEDLEKNKSSRFVSLCVNPWLNWKIKFLDWVNDYPLQLLHCLPTYTELDSLEKGWRKRFGIDLCKDLRRALIKSGGYNLLFSYRIHQIKEKWGYLHWYGNGYNKEIDEVLEKYEKLSEETCIICGKPATWTRLDWISPYCDDHVGDKNQAKKLC